jgi:hypothetical protein
MPGGLKKHLVEIAERRVEELRTLLLKNDMDYADQRAQSYELQRTLITTLNSKQKRIFAELETMQNSQEAFIHDELYKYGFMDGIKAAKLILKCNSKDIKSNFGN